ncbi:metal-dependent hydrolase [Altererythrobacter sp. MF3-039]|uniref:metal-dependent hydrolase n=1 Tax=Altererythrobacter sp. MF3-039 TaxID=3252901 RepID=UPI00390CB0D4
MKASTDEHTHDTHPMDNIEVRPFKFAFEDMRPEEAVWSDNSELFAIFANAFNLHVPYFEQYLVRTIVRAIKRMDDPALVADAKAIIGQEAHHAHSFKAFNRVLARRYPQAKRLESEAKAFFKAHEKDDSFKEMVGFTAGYETFTFLAGMIFLEKYEEWFSNSDPAVKAMWVWHQVEEVEHGAVAFDVYKHFFQKDESYRRRMVVKAAWLILSETAIAYGHMCRIEGHWRNPLRALKAVSFFVSMVAKMAWNVLPVFSSGYHPRNHPLATTDQNEIAVSWRRFHKAGGDVLAIDREKMARIMKLQTVG